jgi:hypothetical protein
MANGLSERGAQSRRADAARGSNVMRPTWLGLAALIVVALLEARFDLSIAQLLTPWWRHAPLASETSLRC